MLKAYYQLIATQVDPKFEQMYSLEEFVDAFKIVNNRKFGMFSGLNISQQVMVPFLDFFNHRNKPNVEWYFEVHMDGKIGFFVYALEDI